MTQQPADRIKLPTATRQTVTQKKLRFQDNLNPTVLSFTLFSLSIAQYVEANVINTTWLGIAVVGIATRYEICRTRPGRS